MKPLDDNIDRVLEEFSTDELANLSDDLLEVAIDLTLQDELDLPTVNSIAKGNDLLVIIPKIIASRLNKAEIFSRKFAALDKEDLVFAGYSVADLRSMRKLLEDVITLIERRSQDDLHVLHQEVFEELKENVELDPSLYRRALENLNEAYRIQSRHVMTRAIDVYKHVTAYDFELFLQEDFATLESYRDQLTKAIELLETSELGEKFAAQIQGLRKTAILVLEALSANTIGAGFSRKKMSYIHEILYQIRHQPDEYIFEVIRRFANVSRDRELLDYMKPEEIAIRYRTRYLKHNRVLLSFISNPIEVKQDFVLEVVNTILKNLSTALNVKLQFIRTGAICTQIMNAASDEEVQGLRYFTQTELDRYYGQIRDVLTILETYTIRSEYLDLLQDKCYRAAIAILEWFKGEFLMELADIVRRYQIYAARKLFTLRLSKICLFIYDHPTDELLQLASTRILKVCRELIEFNYDFLKPTSQYLESVFDLERYRTPVVQKIEAALQHASASSLQSEAAAKVANEKRSKTLFSQMVIDCLALKVQELDDSPRAIQEEKTITKHDIRNRVKTSKERTRYFLRQYEEERQLLIQASEEGTGSNNSS
jgi:hypothetical protein